MTARGIHSVRIKIIAAISAAVGIMALLSLAILRVHVRVQHHIDRQMAGIIAEYRLSAETDRLLELYSACIQNPQDEGSRERFQDCARGIGELLRGLGARRGGAEVEALRAGLRNSVLHILARCREGLEALRIRDMMKTEAIYQELIRKQQYVAENSARLILQEIRQAAAQQAEARRVAMRRLLVLLLFLAGAVSACVVYALSVAKRLTQPLSHLSSVARTIAAGDMAAGVDAALLARRDETGSLSRSFEQMLAHLRTTLAYLNSEVEVRKRAEQRAERASAAKSEFLANISHEIRTPMNAIIGFADLLAEEIPDDRQRQQADVIARSGKSLLRLINDLLDLSKIEAGKLEIHPDICSPVRLLEEVRQVFALSAGEKGIELVVSADGSLPAGLRLDEGRARQILVNLVGNAIKFTDAGSVAVRAACVRPPDGPPRCDLSFTVADTGIGIPAELKDRLFGAFEQAAGQDHAKYGGTGLGLPISRRLARLMNGEITVADNPGGGAIFTLALRDVPVAEGAPESAAPASGSGPSGVSAGPARPRTPLEEGLLAEIAVVRKNLRISQVKALAERLSEAGAAQGAPEIVRFGGELAAAAAAFQIDRIQALLHQAADFAARSRHGTDSEVRMKGHP